MNSRLQVVSVIVLMGITGCATTPSITIALFDSTISFAPPDTSVWKVAELGQLDSVNRAFVEYMRTFEDQSRDLPPVIIGFSVEHLPVDMTVLDFFKVMRNPDSDKFKTLEVTNLTGGFHDAIHLTAEKKISYPPLYPKETLHKLLIGYLVHGRVGIVVICASPAELFPRVAKEMITFRNSISVTDGIAP